MAKVSILIPSRAEKPENLLRTLDSIYNNATGDFEVLVGFDGPPFIDAEALEPLEVAYPNLKVVRLPEVAGIKTMINLLAAMATGKYIYKSDAHCAFGKGFDEILQADMEEDWIVTPRFKIIKEEDWSIQTRDGQEEFYDYFYLCCPFTDPKGFRFKAGGHWPERTKERDPFTLSAHSIIPIAGNISSLNNLYIDETPQIHGSGWFMTKDRFFELGGFPNIDPYGHAQEPIWLALKNWLMGGKVMVNKKTWYAHMHQQGNKRGYSMDKEQENKSYRIAAEHFVGDKGNYLHNFEWFVDKFMPMPTWPDNWRDLLNKYQEETK